jgi:N,N-dimethylformamidase beta subunit-like protein
MHSLNPQLIILATLLWPCLVSCDRVINGYTDKISYNPGDTMSVFLNPNRTLHNFEVTLYDINKNKVTDSNGEVIRITTTINAQDTSKDNPWKNGFGYDQAFRFKIPDLKSGVYLWEKKVPFVVKAKDPEIVVLYSSNTDNAYTTAGGKSLYSYDTITKTFAGVVSFLRPIWLPGHSADFLKWFQTLDYENVGYICDMDLDNYNNFRNAKVLIIPGHSEYWTRKARENFDRFVDDGKDAIILSGNTMWWQVRYNEKGDQLICYKSFEHDTIADPLQKTITWDESVLHYPVINSIGVESGLAGYGTRQDKGWDGYRIVNENSPLLAGTGLKNGDIIKLPSHEVDGIAIKGVDTNGQPVIDNDFLKFYKVELVGYDSVTGYHEVGIETWITLKRTATSGIILNVASTDWCAKNGMRKNDHEVIKKITTNMIDKILKKEDVFSPSNSEIFVRQ